MKIVIRFVSLAVFIRARRAQQPLRRRFIASSSCECEIPTVTAAGARLSRTMSNDFIQRARRRRHQALFCVRLPGDYASSEVFENSLTSRAALQPVVASMGDVAASGGYWIAMGADEVIADAATITGSIGVFGLLPTFDGTMEKLGVNVDGVSTTWLAGATDLRRPVDKRLAQTLELVVNSNYSGVHSGWCRRPQLTPRRINGLSRVGCGTGAQAKERGLVD